MRITLTFVASVFSAAMLFGQGGKLKRANNYYNTLAYALAAQEYESLLGSEVDSPQMKARLAHCYFEIGNTQQAETYYAQMITSGQAGSEDVYHYAQSLKENGKYAESDQWMLKYAEMEPNDARVTEFRQKLNYLELIEKQGVHFSVKTLAVNTPYSDFGGYPSVDRQRIYFVTSRDEKVMVNKTWGWNAGRFLDLYSGTPATDQQISEPKLMTRRVNTEFHEGPLCFSGDGRKVYFTRNNLLKGVQRVDQDGIQNLKLYIADVAADGSWTNEREFVYNSREYSVGHPTLSADGQYLYFVSDMPGGIGGADIYRAQVMTDGTFGKPENLGKTINTEGQDMFPWLNSEGHLFFSSDGHTGLGGLDIFVMIPDGRGGGKVLNVGKPVNSQKDDFAFTMNKDNATGYFSSNREGGAGDDDIYAYTLTKPFRVSLVVEGIALEKGTNKPLPLADVELRDAAGTPIGTVKADAGGNYRFSLEPDKDYTIAAKQKDYFDNRVSLTSKNLPEGTEKLEKNIELEKDPGLALYALVTDKKTGNPLEGVKMIVTDNMTGKEFITTNTPATGDAVKGIADKKIGDRLSYNIVLTKEGYLSKTVTFNAQITQPGVINVSNALDLSLEKLDAGMDLAKLIDIKPIYFDLNKYVIRPDAAKELDKIVKIMNEYPTMEVELGSHTDCRGSMAANATLSDNRAKASATYIQSRITNPQRIYGKGYGETKLKNGCACEGPVKSTCSETEHQENRRTEFIITKM